MIVGIIYSQNWVRVFWKWQWVKNARGRQFLTKFTRFQASNHVKTVIYSQNWVEGSKNTFLEAIFERFLHEKQCFHPVLWAFAHKTGWKYTTYIVWYSVYEYSHEYANIRTNIQIFVRITVNISTIRITVTNEYIFMV